MKERERERRKKMQLASHSQNVSDQHRKKKLQAILYNTNIISYNVACLELCTQSGARAVRLQGWGREPVRKTVHLTMLSQF